MMIKDKSTDIVNIYLCFVMTLYGATLSLMNILIPSLVIRNIIVVSALILEFLIIVKKKVPAFLTVHMLLIVLFCFYRSAWSNNNMAIYAASVFFVLIYMYNIKLAKMILTALYYCDFFYCIATVFLRFNKNLYINYVVKLFPSTESRLIDWYNSNCMSGLTEHYSTNAMLLSVGFIIALSQLMAHLKAKEVKYKDIFEVLLFVVGILLTGKRGHVIFAFFASLVIIFCSMKEKNTMKRAFVTLFRAALIILVFGLILRYVPFLSSFVSRFHSAGISDNTDISHGRFELWKLAWNTFKDHPLFGIGWKQYKIKISPQYSTRATYDTHNVYLQLLCETGIIGATVFISWFIWMFVVTVKEYRKKVINSSASDFETRFLLCFSLTYQAFFLSYCLTGNPLYVRIMFIPYFTACGITMHYHKRAADVIKSETIKGEINK